MVKDHKKALNKVIKGYKRRQKSCTVCIAGGDSSGGGFGGSAGNFECQTRSVSIFKLF